MQLSIIIPTYNERKNVGNLIPKLEKLIKKLKVSAEVIIVDDNSSDRTADLANELNKEYKNIRVILRPKKEGMGAAIKEGLDKAKGKILISMDVDSFEVQDIEKLYKKMMQGYDMASGSRHIPGGIYEKRFLKTRVKYIISFLGNKLYKWFLIRPIDDFSLNFRAMKKEVWKKLNIKEKGNTFMPEIIAETYFKGFKISQVPVAFRERVFEASKLSLTKESYKFLVKLIAFIYKYKLKSKSKLIV